jgi:hypothetical protein
VAAQYSRWATDRGNRFMIRGVAGHAGADFCLYALEIVRGSHACCLKGGICNEADSNRGVCSICAGMDFR